MLSYLLVMPVAAMLVTAGEAVALAFEAFGQMGSPQLIDHRSTMLGVVVVSLGDALVSDAHVPLRNKKPQVSSFDL